MLPLAIALFLLVAGFSAMMLWHQKRHLNEIVSSDIMAIPEDFSRVSNLQVDALRVALGFIADDPAMHAALRARDREQLLSLHRPLFAGLLHDRGITQFSFYDPNRVNLVRLHDPARYGDVVERFTVCEAQRAGKAVAGVELARSGLLSLRLVEPVFDGDQLIGFVELGKSIEEVMEGLGNKHGMDIAVVVHKDLLDRRECEASTPSLGSVAEWERFPEDLLIYSSLPQLPTALDPYMNEKNLTDVSAKLELTFGGASRRVAFLPLMDASNNEVGHFIILCDTSTHREAFARSLCIVGAGCLLLFSLLLGFFYVVLKNTDRGIEARALALRESEAKWRSITENSPDTIILVSPELEILFISRTLPDLGIEQLCGTSILDLMPSESRHWAMACFKQVLKTGKPATYVSEHPLATGGIRYLESTVGPVLCDGQVTTLVVCCRDVSDRKRAEEALQQESLFRKAIIANAAEGLCVCHKVSDYRSFVFTVWNDRMTEITGYTMDEINRLGWLQMIRPDPDVQTRAAEFITRAQQDEDLRGQEWVVVRRDGQERTVLMSISHLVSNHPDLHVLVMVQDITERKQAEIALHRHVQEVERFNRLATERELRVMELKQRVNELSCAAGQSPPFDLQQEDSPSECAAIATTADCLPGSLVECPATDYHLDDLLDRGQMQKLLDSYCDAVGIAAGIVDLQGRVSVQAHWQRICTDFHRVNPQTCTRCIESDTVLSGQLQQAERFSLYQCRNGLTDAASPIIIEGHHVGNVFVGQFLLKPPDEAFFRSQAAEFGFDETAYLDALSHVPVITEAKLPAILMYMTTCARLLAQLGLDRVRDKAHKAELLRRAEDMDQTNKALRRQREAALSLAEDAYEARAATERVQQSFRQSEEKYRRLVDNSLVGIGVSRADRIVYANQSLLRMYGYDDFDEFASRSFLDYLTPQSRAFVEEWGERRKRGEEVPCVFEHDIVRKDGAVRSLQLSISPIPVGDSECIQTAFIDITERKLAEQALQRSEEELRTVIEAARDAIVMMGPEGEVTLWSPGAEETFGWSAEEVLGKPVHQLLAPERFLNAQAKGFLAFQTTGQGPAVGKTLELEAKHKDGHEFPVELSLSAIRQAGCWHAVAIVRDISERKQFEKRIQNQLQLLRTLMDAIPYPIYYKDAQLRYLGCNHAWEKLLGITQDQTVGKTVYDVAPKDLADRYHAADAELLAHPGFQTYEGTLVSVDGVRHDVLFRKATFQNAEGGIGGIVAVALDTTELARAEEALLVKDSALSSAASGIILVDLGGRLTYANPSCLKMWGFDDGQEALDRSFLSLFQSQEQGVAAYQSALETGAWRGELAARKKDGCEFIVQVSASVVKDKQGKPVCMMASLVDVTESRRLSDILDRKQKNLEAIFDAAPLGMLLVNEQRRVVRANDTIRQISGKDYREILNQHPCQALACAHGLTELPSSDPRPGRETCSLQKLVEDTFESGLSVHGVEARLVFNRDGKQTQPWFSISLEPVDVDGDKHVLIALHDITGRKEAEEQLRDTMEMKSQFISTVSHEVRTPLTAMKEAVIIVADGISGKLNKDQTHFLDIARRNIDRLALLIDDVLDFQKLNAGKMKFHMQSDPIDKAIGEACDTMLPHTRQKQLHLVVDLEANLPSIPHDHDRIIQVVTNLLSNAIKFTPEGGQISVSTRRCGEDLAVSVSDTGMGIPKEALPKIFTQFYRVHRPGKEIKGTGLGLAIVARIVAGHGGRIDVESEVDKGTTFTFLLPLVPKPAPGEMPPQADDRLENTLTNGIHA
jgi:PAS domain S-box-containing protein